MCNTVVKDAVKSKRFHNGRVVEESSEVLLTSISRVVLWVKCVEVFYFSKTGQTTERYFSSLSFSSTNMGNPKVHGVGCTCLICYALRKVHCNILRCFESKWIKFDWRMISNPLASLICQLTHFVMHPHSMPTPHNMSSPPSLLHTCGLWKYNVTHYLGLADSRLRVNQSCSTDGVSFSPVLLLLQATYKGLFIVQM